jgi:glycosyltransferase involved in cell wall biosynthesis
MINIISKQVGASQVTGPQKVLVNLVKGLDRIRYPYVLNRHPSAARRLWIHDDSDALRFMHHPGVLPVLGPNLFVMPGDCDPHVDFRDALYLQPCEWAARFWERAGFTRCPIVPWAVGIDTEEFRPASDAVNERTVMVYHKMRDPQELVGILDAVRAQGLVPKLVLYGGYDEDEYHRILSGACLAIWHGRAESQGIALQEALACNVPMLVCDVTSVRQTRGGYPFDPEVFAFPVSAAPYFDKRCGVRITDLRDFDAALTSMVEKLGSFRPRDYVLENLSLEGQARAFVNVWLHWGLSPDEGLSETLRNPRLWQGPPLHDRIRRRVVRHLTTRWDQLASGRCR